VLNYLENPDLFPVLTGLIERAALPLAAVESNFAVDSTGFCFSRFARWYDVKYNRFTQKQEWVKAHVMCGVKTNVITAIEIHDKDAAMRPSFGLLCRPRPRASPSKRFQPTRRIRAASATTRLRLSALRHSSCSKTSRPGA
jgi:hypothetical protein